MIVYKYINKPLIIKLGMHPPSDILVKTILPALRGLVTHRLHDNDYSQSKIAAIIGITQASVSMYLANNPTFHKNKMLKLGIKDQDIDRYTKTLCEDLIRGRVEAIYTLTSIWRNLLISGLLCPTHKKEASILEDCDVCMRLYGSVSADIQKDEVLREVNRAAAMVEASPLFQHVMPEVSVNIVMALPDGETEADVAAFPGRMVKIHGWVKHMLPAEFGASRHMARVLLTAMKHNPELRAAVNIKFDDKIADILSGMYLNVIHISRRDHEVSLEGDVVVSAFKTKLNSGGILVPQVVTDEGGEGLEPITYIFGRNATEAVRRTLAIAKKYVGQSSL